MEPDPRYQISEFGISSSSPSSCSIFINSVDIFLKTRFLTSLFDPKEDVIIKNTLKLIERTTKS
jgi:hypothetical protein